MRQGLTVLAGAALLAAAASAEASPFERQTILPEAFRKLKIETKQVAAVFTHIDILIGVEMGRFCGARDRRVRVEYPAKDGGLEGRIYRRSSCRSFGGSEVHRALLGAAGDPRTERQP